MMSMASEKKVVEIGDPKRTPCEKTESTIPQQKEGSQLIILGLPPNPEASHVIPMGIPWDERYNLPT